MRSPFFLENSAYPARAQQKLQQTVRTNSSTFEYIILCPMTAVLLYCYSKPSERAAVRFDPPAVVYMRGRVEWVDKSPARAFLRADSVGIVEQRPALSAAIDMHCVIASPNRRATNPLCPWFTRSERRLAVT